MPQATSSRVGLVQVADRQRGDLGPAQADL
jgi:hypothetical protein